MNKRVLSFLFAFASFAGIAAAQFSPPYSCAAVSGPQPIRSEGVAEYTADIVITCTGGIFNYLAPQQSLTVSLNANITSKVGQSNTSEATLLINEAASGSRSEGFNIFRGVQASPNSVRFDFVSVFEPGSSQFRIYRFSNIRVDASQLPPGTPIQALVTTTGLTTLPVGTVTTGIVQQPQAFDVRTCNDSQTSFVNFHQSSSQNTSLVSGPSTTANIQFNVRFAGNFIGAYRRSIAPDQNPFVPNSQYNSESDFVDLNVLGPIPGVATQGTRLMSRFSNIPAGVRLFVTTQPLGPGGASTTTLAANLISVDANGAGSATVVEASETGTCATSGATQFIAELPIVNGTAQAVWEVTSSSPTALEKASFGVVVAYNSAPQSPALGTATVNGRLGPVSTIATPSATAPAPRFAASTTNIPAFAIGADTVNNGVSITTRSIPNGIVGTDYPASLAATGGVTPYTWSADLQSLPPGVSLSSGGVFSGKPTRAGSFRVSVSVSDVRGSSDGTVFSMTVTGPPLSIVTTTLGNGTVGTPYSGSVQATGGIPPYVFGVLTGSLPAGLALAADGTISGTPTAPGSANFTVQVADAAVNPQGKATKAFSITVVVNPPAITTTSLSNGVAGVPYSASVAATGGLPPYTFSVASGSLPDGLRLGSGGDITGTPTALGDSSVTIQVTDKLNQTATKGFSLKIVAPPSITTNSPLGLLIVGTPSQIALAATGGTLPYTWSVTGGSLPAGLSLDSGSGAINGNPSAAGTYSFAATVTDANKLTATKPFTGRVTTPVRITTASPLPAATVGTPYSAKIDATGGTIPYRFSADTLPAGLSIDSSGLLTGTLTEAVAGAFSVTVTDADSLTASARFTLAIALPQLSGVTIGGVTDTPPPAQQQNVTVVLGSAFPVPLTGTVTVTFASDANVPADDPAIQFSTGGRTAAFTIPAGSTQATFTAPNPAIQTGTVSGTITLTTSLQAGGAPVACNCALTRIIRVAKSVPVITSVRAVRGSGAITITIIGFSTSREITQAAFQFTTAAGSNVTTTSFTVPVSTFFTTWYTGTQSTQFGSQFLMTQPFTISGDANAVTNVSVTLTNAQGTSTAVSAAVQ